MKKKARWLHAAGSSVPGMVETPASSSAEMGFVSFLCSLGERLAEDFWDDKASVCNDKLPFRYAFGKAVADI